MSLFSKIKLKRLRIVQIIKQHVLSNRFHINNWCLFPAVFILCFLPHTSLRISDTSNFVREPQSEVKTKIKANLKFCPNSDQWHSEQLVIKAFSLVIFLVRSSWIGNLNKTITEAQSNVYIQTRRANYRLLKHLIIECWIIGGWMYKEVW